MDKKIIWIIAVIIILGGTGVYLWLGGQPAFPPLNTAEQLTIEETKELLSQSLLVQTGVISVDIEECGGEPCIQVVLEKGLKNLPELQDKIPSESHGFKVVTKITSIFCTLEAKICPDGSTVGRTGPNCEFALCPVPGDQNESGGCVITGCSGQICAGEEEKVTTTCEFRPEYACYADAVCKRQANGQCGWTSTPELTSCLQSAVK